MKVMNGDKVLGPDGFFMAFFQAYWNVLKVKVMSCNVLCSL